MRILVTGATGFIGRHVVRSLSANAHQLLALTRASQVDLDAEQGVATWVSCDLENIEMLESHMKDFRPEALIHLAWEGLPDYSRELCLRNLSFSVDLFSAAARAGCSYILGAGSCWEYANPKGPITEEDLLESVEIFPSAKNALRLIGEAIALRHQIHFYWLRLFFVYGPGQREFSLIPYLYKSIVRERLPKLRTPRDRCDFVYVTDVADAMVTVLEKSPPGTVFNVGSGASTSVEDIVRRLYLATGRSPDERIFSGEDTERVKDFWADISRIQSDTGWQPQYDIESGIRAAVSSMREGG